MFITCKETERIYYLILLLLTCLVGWARSDDGGYLTGDFDPYLAENTQMNDVLNCVRDNIFDPLEDVI